MSLRNFEMQLLFFWKTNVVLKHLWGSWDSSALERWWCTRGWQRVQPPFAPSQKSSVSHMQHTEWCHFWVSITDIMYKRVIVSSLVLFYNNSVTWEFFWPKTMQISCGLVSIEHCAWTSLTFASVVSLLHMCTCSLFDFSTRLPIQNVSFDGYVQFLTLK